MATLMARRRIAGLGLLRCLSAGTLCALLVVACAGPVRAAEPAFPALDGRVTDAAGVLPQDVRERLTAKLKAAEDKSGDQLVIATVPTLQGLTVEDYANRLFREWKIGQAKQNNGALLLVAPSERKVRIEVGYGLEGALTDAVSKVIITTAITPKFKQGDLPGGIEAGADAILSIMAGDAQEWQRHAPVRTDSVNGIEVVFWMILIVFLVLSVWRMNARGGGGRLRGRGGNVIFFPPPSSGGWSGGFSGGGGFSDGGFSGGGGSSGGGGASGDW